MSVQAQWIANTVTITINKDGSSWTGSDMTIALNGTSFSASATSSTVTFSAVPTGTYTIYASKYDSSKATVNSGVSITVTENGANAGSATINYYTVTVNAGTDTHVTSVSVNGGTAGTSVSDIVLSGQKVTFSATVEDGYTFAGWVGSISSP